jgi:hypothetical protein
VIKMDVCKLSDGNNVHINIKVQTKKKKKHCCESYMIKTEFFNNMLLIKLVITAANYCTFILFDFNTLLLILEQTYDIFIHCIANIRFLVRYYFTFIRLAFDVYIYPLINQLSTPTKNHLQRQKPRSSDMRTVISQLAVINGQ